MEEKKSNYSYILKEIEIYKKLGPCKSIPKIYWSGSYKNYNVLIMDLLGPSLKKIFIKNNNIFSFQKL